MNVTRLLLMLLRVGAAVQLVLGIGVWTGHWVQAIPVHQTIGMGFVLVFWVLAIIALVRRANIGLALFAIVWGVVIAGLGFAQRGILIGDFHWIVRVAHLVIAMSALPIAERLARHSSRGALAMQAS